MFEIFNSLPFEFLEIITGRLAKTGFEIESHLIDHICYRVETTYRYEEIKTKLLTESGATLLSDEVINGRIISTIRLPSPIVFKSWRIDILELPMPKPNNPRPEGWQHIEVVVDNDLKELMTSFSSQQINQSEMSHVFNPAFAIDYGDGLAVKFHKVPLATVIELEKAAHDYDYMIEEAKKDGVTRLNIDSVIIQDNKILHIHRHPNNPKFPDRWCLPGGGVDEGEGVIESLIREVREELGVEVVAIKKLVINHDGSPLYWDTHSPDHSKTWRMTYFVVEVKGEIQLMEPDKHDKFVFTSKEELSEYYTQEELDPQSSGYRKELEVWNSSF